MRKIKQQLHLLTCDSHLFSSALCGSAQSEVSLISHQRQPLFTCMFIERCQVLLVSHRWNHQKWIMKDITWVINAYNTFFSLTYIHTCPWFVDDVIANDIRAVRKIGSYLGPEASHTVPQAIGVVVEVLVGNTDCLRGLVRAPRMLGTVLVN